MLLLASDVAKLSFYSTRDQSSPELGDLGGECVNPMCHGEGRETQGSISVYCRCLRFFIASRSITHEFPPTIGKLHLDSVGCVRQRRNASMMIATARYATANITLHANAIREFIEV